MKPHEFDGIFTGDGEGGLYRVYEPRWWQLARWIAWWRMPTKTSITMTLGGREITLRVVRGKHGQV